MRISLPSLSEHFNQGLQPVYHFFGAETLLLEEAVDLFRVQATEAGYLERLRFTSETGFDWNQITDHMQSVSIFAEKKVIELRIPSGKPGDAGAKALIFYMSMQKNADTILVIISGEIDKRAQNTKWFKAVEGSGVVVECPAINVAKLPEWIAGRMTRKGLSFDRDVAERLAYFVEGNLLAAAQEINLLTLLYPDRRISVELMEKVIADHARFDVYGFVNACLSGATNRCIRILQSLKREQVEPIVILWALSRDTRTLCNLLIASAQGENPQSLFQKHGVWGARSRLITGAMRRLTLSQCLNLLRRLGRIDLMVKGRASFQRENIWEEIESVALGLCGLRVS
ncbi:MAG: DNA polymerase III subunit delta [Gammaproteobacteria bacterium]|nr:DNA polymerase III subunit delta [Gammaproteobacteria bacterium]